jgi:hypothetical protein
MAKLEEEEFEKNHKTISYDVVLTKVGGSASLNFTDVFSLSARNLVKSAWAWWS